MFSWDQKQLIDIHLLYQEQSKCRFPQIFPEDPLAPLRYSGVTLGRAPLPLFFPR